MRKEPSNYNFDPHKFLLEHGEELEQGIIHEEDISDIFDFILEAAIQDVRATTSFLQNLYSHLLKYKYQPDHQTRSWITTIRRSSRDVLNMMESSKALRNKITEEIQEKAYNTGRRYASAETKLPIKTFPENIPEEFDINKITDSDYIESYLEKYAYSWEAKKVLML